MIRSRDITTHQPVQIRRAAPQDIPAIVAIEEQLFIDPWEQAVFLEALTYYPTTYFVAVMNGTVIGFIVGAMENTGENIYGHICNLAVNPPVQRMGIGRHLIRREEHQFAVLSAAGVQLEARCTQPANGKIFEGVADGKDPQRAAGEVGAFVLWRAGELELQGALARMADTRAAKVVPRRARGVLADQRHVENLVQAFGK